MAGHRVARFASERDASPRFVAYYRVSTAQQGASGLGLEAQKAAVARHIQSSVGHLIAEYQEIESGKKTQRPQLKAALGACRLRRATLLVAKLDRLARNAHFLLGLRDAGVDFIAADMPSANRLTVGVMALVAEEERDAISQRTKAALAAAKARGVKLGNPRLKQRPGSRALAKIATAVRTARSHAHAADVLPYILAARKAGCVTDGQIAQALTARGIETPAGRSVWNSTQVRRVLSRAA